MRPAARARDLGEPDRLAAKRGYCRICGLDEVGRGPLAGPVVAAAVAFPPGTEIHGLADSKSLTPSSRARLVPAIYDAALGVGIGLATPKEIDRINILRASLLAMVRAVEDLPIDPDYLLVDGNHAVPLPLPQEALIQGDGRSTSISAASVVAKEHRDAMMTDYARVYPGYGFERNKGYPTHAHRDALRRLGPSLIHRASFKGVRGPIPLPLQLDFFSFREGA